MNGERPRPDASAGPPTWVDFGVLQLREEERGAPRHWRRAPPGYRFVFFVAWSMTTSAAALSTARRTCPNNFFGMNTTTLLRFRRARRKERRRSSGSREPATSRAEEVLRARVINTGEALHGVSLVAPGEEALALDADAEPE